MDKAEAAAVPMSMETEDSIKERVTVSESRAAGQASTAAVVLVAAAAAGWLWWRRRQQHKQEEGDEYDGGSRANSTGAAAGNKTKGGRSPFGFGPRPGGPTSSSGPAATGAPGPATHVAGARRRPNPKKERAGRRQQKEERKKGGKAGGGAGGALDLIHNAEVIGKAEAREAAEAARTVKYVDLSKMDEVYDRVRDYQETGKKKYK